MKNKKGFTLIEVMVALAIIATALVSILSLEISLVKRTQKSTNKLIDSWRMKNFMYKNSLEHKDKRESFEKAVTEDNVYLKYELKFLEERSKNSNLSPEKLMQESTTAIWESEAGAREDVIIKFKYLPEEEKDEKGNRAS